MELYNVQAAMEVIPEPAIPGPSGVSTRQRGKRKRHRSPSPASDTSLSNNEATRSITTRLGYDTVILSDTGDNVSDTEMSWGIGLADEDWSFLTALPEEQRKLKYQEFPETYCSTDLYDSLPTVMYRRRMVTEYATSIVTDSEDDIEFLIQSGVLPADYWSYDWDGDTPVRRDDYSPSDYPSMLQQPAPDAEAASPRRQEPAAEEQIREEPVAAVEHSYVIEVVDSDSNSDDGFEAGEEDNGVEDVCDEEVPEDDKWECISCKTRNHPMTRRCLNCWNLHQDYLPLFEMQRTTSGASTDSAISVDMSDGAGTSSEAGPSSDVRGYQRSLMPGTNDLCLVCISKPRNASMIHRRTGHQVCCYSCARKLQRIGQPCPICRQTIEMVVKNYL